jgi:hypothetical protein
MAQNTDYKEVAGGEELSLAMICIYRLFTLGERLMMELHFFQYTYPRGMFRLQQGTLL